MAMPPGGVLGAAAAVNCSFGFGSTQLLPATMKSPRTNECVMAARMRGSLGGGAGCAKYARVCALASANCSSVCVVCV